MTNGERLRQMDNVDLAKQIACWLARFAGMRKEREYYCDACPAIHTCDCIYGEEEKRITKCWARIFAWLEADTWETQVERDKGELERKSGGKA